MKNLTTYLLAGMLIFSAPFIIAQDSHLSQYNASPVTLNPALTGIIPNGDFRIAANYRTQWGSIASASFTTTAIAFDTHMGTRWGVGGYALNSDLGGFMNAFNFMLSGSYLITDPSQNKYKISTGIQAGIMLKQLDQQEFVFDSQYEDGNFEKDNPSGETFQNNSILNPDLNWGISYIHTDESWKVKPYFGMSVFHLTFSKENFSGDSNDKLPVRWAFNGGAKYDPNDRLRIIGRSLYMMQGTAREINFGALTYYTLNNTDYTLIGGLDARWQDAAIIHLGLRHKHLTYRLSYDVNTSSLNGTTRGRGGTELSIVYTPPMIKSNPSFSN